MTSDQATRPNIEASKGAPSRVSLIWLLPMAALLFAAFMLWQAYADRGPLVTILFESAGGVIAGETRVLSNDVAVGMVESVRLSDDLRAVVVEARMNPEVAPYVDTDTEFWVVNARINTTEISGLGTLLSGAYIEVDWDDSPGTRESEFVGLVEPPLTRRGTPGMRDGLKVLFDIFVEAPYHRFIYPGTKFFGVSGVEANINADGATVRVESMSALFTGGIAFETEELATAEEPLLRNNTQFKLYDSRNVARESVFENEGDESFRYIAEFEGSIKGLRKGSPIEYNGIRVGQVVAVNVEPPAEAGQRTRIFAVLQFQPSRLGFKDIDKTKMDDILQNYIDMGLRVQLATGNLLTGSLVVKLVERPDAPAASIDTTTTPYASLPTTPSNVEAVTADVETLVRNLAELPLESLVVAATDLLRDTGTLVGNEDLARLPGQLSESLASIASTATQVEAATSDLPRMMNALTAAAENADEVLEGVSPDSEIYVELSATVRELRDAAKSIARFAELLEDNPNALLTGR